MRQLSFDILALDGYRNSHISEKEVPEKKACLVVQIVVVAGHKYMDIPHDLQDIKTLLKGTSTEVRV